MSEIIEPEELDEETSEPPLSELGERDAALAAVLREQSEKAEVEAHTREVRIRRQGIGARHLTLLVATVLSIWFWISPPSVLQVRAAAPPPLEVEEATLRLVMYFQTQKIEQYRLDTGRVPIELEDAGPVFPGMEYIRLTNRDYRILGRTSRMVLSYSSAEPIDLFVGQGAEILDLTVMN